MKLQNKLIELRKEKGWSQEDLADKLDISRQAISRWENGTALPDAQNILRISKLFNVTADYLLNDENADDTKIPAAEPTTEDAPPPQKKKFPYYYVIIAVCVMALAACLIAWIATCSNQECPHASLSSVKENEVASSCSAQGSYDEVIYCAECEEELMRVKKSTEKLSHVLSSGKKENEVAPTCKAEGTYDEVIYCTECNEELMRAKKSTAKLSHVLSSSKKENEVAPSCTAEGSYDEVVYCTKCKVELLRTKRYTEKLEHNYQDKICTVCKTDQPSEGLMYFSNGDGTCFVALGECQDENIVIPSYAPNGEKVTQIKAFAFSGNKKLKSIKIPETVTAIGEAAFKDCTNLESVKLPTKMKRIESDTFYGCKSLKEITLPTNLYWIGPQAFADCISCESIVIPASVQKIGPNAFMNFSECKGTVTFEVYSGWMLYDDSDRCVSEVDFQNSSSSPTILITWRFSEYMWKLK